MNSSSRNTCWPLLVVALLTSSISLAQEDEFVSKQDAAVNRAPNSSPPAKSAEIPLGQTIVAFGDSTTATRGKLQTYSAVLEKKMTAAGAPFQVINAGVGGNTTERAKARFEKDVLRHNPDVVVIQFGINDAAVDVWKNPPVTQSRVSLERYEANLRHFVKSLKAKGSRVILMTPNPMRWTPKLKQLYGRPPYKPDEEDGFNVRLRLYAEVVRKIAKRESLPLIDVYQLYEKAGKEEGQSVSDLLLDGMHPNDRGHQLIAKELARHLKSPAKICP